MRTLVCKRGVLALLLISISPFNSHLPSHQDLKTMQQKQPFGAALAMLRVMMLVAAWLGVVPGMSEGRVCGKEDVFTGRGYTTATIPKSCKELKLSKLGDRGAAAIAEALKSNTGLTALTLQYNQFGDKGATAIAKALKTTALVTLNFHNNNNIGDIGATAIADEVSTLLLRISTLAHRHIGTLPMPLPLWFIC